ncbi:MAG: hypothetical protein PHD87_09020 [Candidatus Cloacimonetes bacterium]|nr:hypothetical protein [Candidatus Cloacimonadota bacterium]
MRKLLIIALACLAAMAGISCNREKDKLPDGSAKVSEYATIPSFQAVFLALDKLDAKDLDGLASSGATLAAERDTLRAAFAWGTLVAEAQLAVAGKNSGWLNSVLEQLGPLEQTLGQPGLVERLEQGVKPLVAYGDWEQVKRLFYDLQATVDKNLLDQARYPEYTLSALGSWTATVNQIGGLIRKNYSTETSRALKTKAWDNLADNLLLMDSGRFALIFEQVQDLRDIMNTAGQNALTPEQVEAMMAATDKIRTSFETP